MNIKSNAQKHYCTGDVEFIDAVRSALGLEGFIAFCRGACLQQLWKAGKTEALLKNLKDAQFYLEEAIQEIEWAEGENGPTEELTETRAPQLPQLRKRPPESLCQTFDSDHDVDNDIDNDVDEDTLYAKLPDEELQGGCMADWSNEEIQSMGADTPCTFINTERLKNSGCFARDCAMDEVSCQKCDSQRLCWAHQLRKRPLEFDKDSTLCQTCNEFAICKKVAEPVVDIVEEIETEPVIINNEPPPPETEVPPPSPIVNVRRVSETGWSRGFGNV